ncbi:MAG: phage portal protein, partial [Chloroflexi bacterium]|nr:phage portal protein [Chloroflexota bacterium]
MFEGIQLRRKKALWEMEQIESQRSTLHSIEEALSDVLSNRNSLKDSDEAQWERTADPTKNLDVSDQQTMRQQATKFFYRNAHGRGIIRLYEKYVVGRGFSLTPSDELKQVLDYWKAFWRKNHMERRKKEIVRRAMRDGEIFLRFFKDKDGIPLVRFVNPEMAVAPPEKAEGIVGNASYGIETDKEDIENVLAYWIKGKRVPAEEILHYKILVDSDVKRGRSILEVVMPKLTQYDTWLSDRMRLNKVRSSIGLIKTITGSPTQVANIASQTKTSSVKQPDGSYMQKLMDGINMIVANKGVDYKFIAPDIQAADVQEDGRALLLAIAAGLGFPEYMVTSDASNANYASTLVAEAPGVMEFFDWQDHFAEVFSAIFERVIKYGMSIGEIPEYTLEEVPVEEAIGMQVEAVGLAPDLRQAIPPAADAPPDGQPIEEETPP